MSTATTATTYASDRDLATTTALDLFIARRDFPVEEEHIGAVLVLLERDYPDFAIDQALAHLGTHGTATCCPYIDSEDRDAVEATLTNSLLWQSSEWDGDTWELGADA